MDEPVDPWDRFAAEHPLEEDAPPEPEPAEGTKRVGSVLVFRDTAGDPVAVPEEVVAQAERAWRSWQSHLGGMSWAEVASAEGYPNGEAAATDVALYLERGKAVVVERSLSDAMAVELGRLDALVRAHWAPATKKANHNSSMIVLNTIKLRAALIGLNPEHLGAGSSQGRTVVVHIDEKHVPGGSDGFLEQLQQMANDV